MCRSLLLLMTLAASTASAEYEEEKPSPKLDGSRRFSFQAGWRYAPNTSFYDDYYSRRENRGLERAGGPIGGPLLTGTFAYSVQEFLELGIDLFASYERMRLTRQPGLNAITYGALIGLRLQKRLELGPEGVVPFIGLLTGPLMAVAYTDGEGAAENFGQAFGGTVGATVRITPKWGLSLEYRLIFAEGFTKGAGNYNAFGSGFSVGMNYTFPSVPDRPMSRRF